MRSEKTYYEMMNVGRAKYVVNFHDGERTHPDGSPQYAIAIFKNKKAKNEFLKELASEGYKDRFTTTTA